MVEDPFDLANIDFNKTEGRYRFLNSELAQQPMHYLLDVCSKIRSAYSHGGVKVRLDVLPHGSMAMDVVWNLDSGTPEFDIEEIDLYNLQGSYKFTNEELANTPEYMDFLNGVADQVENAFAARHYRVKTRIESDIEHTTVYWDAADPEPLPDSELEFDRNEHAFLVTDPILVGLTQDKTYEQSIPVGFQDQCGVEGCIFWVQWDGEKWFHFNTGDRYIDHIANSKNYAKPVKKPRVYSSSGVGLPEIVENDPSGVECYQIARHRNFNIGSVFACIWSAGLGRNQGEAKTAEIEALRSAINYLEDEIERLEEEGTDG